MFDLTREEVVDAVASKIVAHLYDRELVDSIRESVVRQVGPTAEAMVMEHVSTWVEAELAKPFRLTNRWGEAKGEPVTLRELAASQIERQLTEIVDSGGRTNRHARDGMPRIEFHAKAAVAAQVESRIKELTKAAVDGALEKLDEDAITRNIKSAVWDALRPKARS